MRTENVIAICGHSVTVADCGGITMRLLQPRAHTGNSLVIGDRYADAISIAMDYVIRPLAAEDELLLWEMLYQGMSSLQEQERPSREIVHRPEFSRYVEGWGRPGDAGFVAHDKKDESLLGAVWLRQPIHEADAPPELALSVKPEHRRHGIGTALLTQLVRANPAQSTISLSFVAGKPVLRLYERFGFKVVEERPDAVVMRREA